MTRDCERVGGINLGQGVCDVGVLPAVRDAAIGAIRENRSSYSLPEGTRELRRAIAEKLARDNGITRDPDSEVVVTLGATGAFTATMMALFDPGDGVILFEPFYGYHRSTVGLLGLTPQFVSLASPNFALDEARLRAAIQPNTRAVVVCTPANPSGKMFSRAELDIIDRLANEHDLVVVTDEIYEYFRYGDAPHVSPATLPGLADRTVTIMGLSKTFSVTGWRLGYAVAAAPLAQAITLVNDIVYVCAPTPLQLAGAAGFAAPRAYFDALRTTYRVKRDMICDALDSAGLRPVVPEGAYYVLADIAERGFSSATEAASKLLATAGVASIAGSAFFASPDGERYLRFCFAKEDDVLAEACRRLRASRI